MILLPIARPAYLKSFALGVSFLGAVIMGVILWWFGFEGALRVAAIVAIGGSTIGVAQPAAVTKLYGYWNTLARYFARGARWLLMAICFYIVFAAVGRTGTSLNLLRATVDRSLWTPKKPVSSKAFHHEHDANGDSEPGENWLASYYLWAKESKQIWALTLLPFLGMLAAVEIYVDRRFPSGVYTLF